MWPHIAGYYCTVTYRGRSQTKSVGCCTDLAPISSCLRFLYRASSSALPALTDCHRVLLSCVSLPTVLRRVHRHVWWMLHCDALVVALLDGSSGPPQVDWVSRCSFKEEDGSTRQCLRAWVRVSFVLFSLFFLFVIFIALFFLFFVFFYFLLFFFFFLVGSWLIISIPSFTRLFFFKNVF